MTTDEKEQTEAAVAEPSRTVSELEAKLKEEIRLRQYTEEVLDSRQQELENQESENTQLRKKLEHLQKELSEARAQSKTKTKQLQDAKDQIFQMQPQRKDITDTEAHDMYKSLVGSVQRWVENRLKAILDDFETNRLRTRPSPVQATRFLSLLRESAKRCIMIDQADEYHVMAIIMNYIWHALYSKSFYCPLDDTEDNATLLWLDQLESSMSRLPRDVATCRQWRSETLAALSSQQPFKTRRNKYLSIISEDLASILSVVVPKLPPTELQTSLRRTIIEPAAELAHKLHLASNVYTLRWPARNPWGRLEVYDCLNLASGGTILDLSGTTSSSPSRRKVSYMFDIAPGLFVERIEGGKKMTMKAVHKPSVLVHGGEGDVVQRATVMRWVWDNSNGVPANPRDPGIRNAALRRPSGPGGPSGPSGQAPPASGRR
ncbi:hypothetical protein HJFPF1_04817 [Paramyrothecium foliicola]|nr:hypothetical protein HJFPF1_04817 [Paramyrothecium foliicola]